ncbi:MAG: ribosome small subunit-dependent GTPase A [Prevotellaceae bacterium]|jgi:ribosome biogenesis GTPase|nr:ribosome small subunit-dependent GTPase A [Prevotellaceae bacterium]
MDTGIVVKHTGIQYTVQLTENDKRINCTLRGKLRLKEDKTTNPVAVGDIVDIEVDENAKSGIIINVHPRKNYIIRKPSNLSKQSHIVAANIDTAFLVVTLILPEVKLEFIDRFLLTTEAYHIHTIIIVNKTDLYKTENLKNALAEFKNIYSKAGYEILEISATEKINIDKLKEKMKDKVSVFLGNSGVGKSTLINCIDCSQNAKTGKISDAHKSGMHTTTFYEMFNLNFGGYIIDTPGLKGFGLIDEFEKNELYHFFPEIFKFSKNCKYNPCSHTHEPQCGVKYAVENGDIAASRYNNYLKILNDDDTKYRY